MFCACWSVKGGSGTTVVTAAAALVLARRTEREVLLVDLAGELPVVLGLREPRPPGLADWLAAGADVPADGLARLEAEVVPGLRLLARGRGPLPADDRAQLLISLLAAESRDVIVDCGTLEGTGGIVAGGLAAELAAAATESLLVIRPCYLALRRALEASLRPSRLVVVSEPGRSLDGSDVEEVLGVPVLVEVDVDPAVARAVDAGLLRSRLPRSLERSLRRAA